MNTQQPTSFNVLLIGDSCIDKYIIGTVKQLSSEAPVPVINIAKEYQTDGMTANVYANLKSMNIDPDFITNDVEIIKTRFIDEKSGQHLLRVDTNPQLSPWSGEIPFPVDTYHAVVISDYNNGFLSYKNIEDIIKFFRVPVFIDTKKDELGKFDSPHVYIKINESEYHNARSLPQISNIIVTLGSRGACLVSNEIGVKEFATTSVEIMDVCGVGDTFLAALVTQYLCTNNIEESIIFANKAAGITIQHRGNYSPTLKEIMAR